MDWQVSVCGILFTSWHLKSFVKYPIRDRGFGIRPRLPVGMKASVKMPRMEQSFAHAKGWALTSQAPPPATMFRFRIARFTIIIASCRLRSTSAMNCSAPPLSTRVQVLAAGQPSKKLNRSPPICRSSNRSQVPRCCGWISVHVEEMLPPVACTTRSRSSEETRPAQKTSRSAKYLCMT